MEENTGKEGSSDKYLNLKGGLANAREKDLAEVKDVEKVDWKRTEMDESDTYIEKELSGTRSGPTQPAIAAEIEDFSSKNNFLISNS
ncbi:MAG: hypothetical protein GY786_25495, partial [Proteobacteria bacterium]|nr:hypothetical protein [Pseudomonadota bacterium]